MLVAEVELDYDVYSRLVGLAMKAGRSSPLNVEPAAEVRGASPKYDFVPAPGNTLRVGSAFPQRPPAAQNSSLSHLIHLLPLPHLASPSAPPLIIILLHHPHRSSSSPCFIFHTSLHHRPRRSAPLLFIIGLPHHHHHHHSLHSLRLMALEQTQVTLHPPSRSLLITDCATGRVPFLHPSHTRPTARLPPACTSTALMSFAQVGERSWNDLRKD